MARWMAGKLRPISLKTPNPWWSRTFRSDAALEAIARAAEEKVRTVALYNYPSFSGAISALFAHLYHSLLNLPCLILPFSSVEPLRVEDFCVQGQGLDTCYLLDFVGPKGFATKLSQQSMCEYAVRRLIRGVSSSREGFALGLTALLATIPSIKVDSLLKLTVQLLEVSSSMKGQEVRDCLLSRLFAYGAIARSDRLTKEWFSDKDTNIIKEFMSSLISLASKNRYLQEPSVSIILEIVENVFYDKVRSFLRVPTFFCQNVGELCLLKHCWVIFLNLLEFFSGLKKPLMLEILMLCC